MSKRKSVSEGSAAAPAQSFLQSWLSKDSAKKPKNQSAQNQVSDEPEAELLNHVAVDVNPIGEQEPAEKLKATDGQSEYSSHSDPKDDLGCQKNDGQSLRADIMETSPSSVLPPSAFHPLIVPTQQWNSKIVKFQTSWYSRFPWLHFNETLGKVLCFVCLRATNLKLHSESTNQDDAFLKTGFGNWRKGFEKFYRHESSNFHKKSLTMLATLESEPVTDQLITAGLLSQEKARTYLRSIFTTAMFLAQQGMSFRGDEHDGGNFIKLLLLRSKDINGLENWLQRSKSFTSWAIQNEILQIVSHMILRRVMSKIREAKYFSIIVDETSDVSISEQVSISIRIVNELFEPEEYFLGLYETASTTGDSLVALILDALQRFNLPLGDIRGQCFDGAANMAGKYKGVQSRILKENSKALFVHCYNHSLNLALQDAAKAIVSIRDSLSTVHELGTLIRGSPKRMAQFNQIGLDEADETVTSRPRPLCPTRWTVRVKSVDAILSAYGKYLILLDDLSTSSDKAATKAKGLLSQMEKGQFYFTLLIAKKVFSPCERFSKILQQQNATLFGISDTAITTVLELRTMKTVEKFEELWEIMREKCLEFSLLDPILERQRSVPKRFKTFDVPRSFENAKQKLQSVYFEFIEVIISEIERRFNQSGMAMYLKCEDALLNYAPCEDSKSGKLYEVCLFYDWNFDNIKSQIEVLKNAKKTDWNSISNIVNEFKGFPAETRSYFSDVSTYLKHLLVVPCSSAGAERSFSMLRRIKTYLRSTMTQARLNHCCVINAYRNEVDSLCLNELMKEFISKGNRNTVFGTM